MAAGPNASHTVSDQPTLQDFDRLNDWQRSGDGLDGGTLTRELRFAHFRAAFAFMAEVALVAERQDHHPDWSNRYNRVTLSITSHDVGRLTDRDLRFARAVDAIAQRHAAANAS